MGSGREGASAALRRREQVGRGRVAPAGRGGVRFGLPRTVGFRTRQPEARLPERSACAPSLGSCLLFEECADASHLRAAEGESLRAAAYYASALVVLESRTSLAAGQHGLLGVAYAGVGREEDGLREATRGVQMRSVSQNILSGPYSVMYLARTCILVGEGKEAVEVLDTLVTILSIYSREFLRVNRAYCRTWNVTGTETQTATGRSRFSAGVNR